MLSKAGWWSLPSAGGLGLGSMHRSFWWESKEWVLHPALREDPQTLSRRLHFDLISRPPEVGVLRDTEALPAPMPGTYSKVAGG